MTKHKYYRDGIEISADEALDRKGLLRDGYTCRVTMRDTNPWADAQFTDGTKDGGGNRPGWRLKIGDTRQAQRDAIAAYDREISNRWKCGDKQSVCQTCSGSGIGRDGSSCDECAGAGVIDDDVYDTKPTPRSARVTDAARHRRNMQRIYDAYDHDIAQQWRMR